MTISQRIFRLMDEQDKKQKELSAFSGISTSAISAWKKNNTSPAAESLSTIADFLGVSIKYLVTGKDDKLTLDEQKLLMYYKSLDPLGKARVSERAETLVEIAEDAKSRRSIIQMKTYTLPASAGVGVDLDGCDQEVIDVYVNPLYQSADFTVRVSGRSMEPMYRDGDIVLVRQVDEMDPGMVGVFIINGSGYIKMCGQDRLISINKDYDDVYPGEDDDFHCCGEVIGVIDPDDLVD